MSERPDRARLRLPPRQPFLRRRELFVLCVCLLGAWLSLRVVLNPPLVHDTTPIEQQTAKLPGGTLPNLPELTLPSADMVSEQHSTVAWLLDSPEQVPALLRSADNLALAWYLAQTERDRQDPPLLRGFAPEDLLQGSIPYGVACFLDADLLDIRRSGGVYWLSIAPLKNHYALVVVPALGPEVTIGSTIRVVGRMLGPLAGTEWQVLGAREVFPVPKSHSVESALDIGVLPTIGQNGNLPPEEEVFRDIDDIAPVLEQRPYYYLIGVVSRLDTYHAQPYAQARSAVAEAIKLHDAPSEYRGDPYHIQAYVLSSWEDQQVARDKPFGIERVLRVVCWNMTWGTWKERQLDGSISSSLRWVRQAFELALITDQPSPPVGALIRASGRFLKVHGVPAEANKRFDMANDIRRHSDNVYFKFFVAGRYEDITPQPIDWKPLGWIFAAACMLIAITTLWLSLQDRRAQAKRPEQIRRLRRSRPRAGASHGDCDAHANESQAAVGSVPPDGTTSSGG